MAKKTERSKHLKTCETCEYLCPFVNDGHGNCILDMRVVHYETYVCEKHKKLKE